MIQNPPATQKTWVQSLGQEDPLEKKMATDFSILVCRILPTEEPGGLQSMESQRVNIFYFKKPNFCKSKDLTLSLFYLPQLVSQSVIQSCPTLCNPMDYSAPGFPVHHQLPELAQTHVHWDSDAIQPSHFLSSPSPPAFNLAQHHSLPVNQFFTSGGQKYWSFSFNISPSNEYSGLISFRMDWFDLL